MAGEGVIIYSGLLALQTKTEQGPVAVEVGVPYRVLENFQYCRL